MIKFKVFHLFLSSGEVCPLLGVDVVYELGLCELYLWCVGHPQLVALEDLGRAALATRGPAAVALPVTKLVRLKLQQLYFQRYEIFLTDRMNEKYFLEIFKISTENIYFRDGK